MDEFETSQAEAGSEASLLTLTFLLIPPLNILLVGEDLGVFAGEEAFLVIQCHSDDSL